MTVNNFKPVQAQNFSLSGGGAVAGATTIVLKSFTQIDGTLLTMTNFGTIGFITLEPGNGTLEEQISFTGVTQNTNGTATLTGVSTVTMVSPYTVTSGLAQTHAGSTTAVLSNTSGYYDQFPKKAVDGTITGKYTFPNDDVSNAGIASDTDTAVATAFVTLGQLSRQAISGAANASTTVKGIVQLSTQAQADAKTTTGSTGALLVNTPQLARSTLLSDYVADTGAADVYVITPSPAITAYTTGQRFSWKVANTNLTTTPTLNVSALGAKTIIKRGTAAMVAGDLIATQIVEVEYDGTNFQLMSPVATAPITSLSTVVKFGGNGSDGALNVTSGTTTISLGGLAIVNKNYTSINVSAGATLAFSNPHANGTVLILRSQGTVTIAGTVTANFGAAGGAAAAQNTNGNNGNQNADILDTGSHFGALGVKNTTTTGGTAGAAGAALSITAPGLAIPYTTATSYLYRYALLIMCGSGGGGGAGASSGGGGSAGGIGGGGLFIESGGALNFTGTINMNGTIGATTVTTENGDGGGGGGGAGQLLILYNSLTANSGSVTIAGGNGGAGGTAVGTVNAGGAGGGGGGAGVISAGGAAGAGGNVNNNGAAGSTGGGSSGGTGGAGGAKSGAGSNPGGGGGGGGGGTGSSLISLNLWFA